MLYRALLNGDEAMMRALARQAVQPVRGHGAGPAGRRHLLPLPHAAEPRPRRRARAADGVGAPSRSAASMTAARGAPRARRVRDRASSSCEGDRGRDPPPAGGRPRRRGDGQDAAQAAARGRRLHARLTRGDGRAAPRDLPAHPQARRAPGPQAAPRAQGPARLPQHGAPLAVLRRRAGRAEVPLPAPGEARDHGRRRHLRFGRGVRPLHAAPRLRDQRPVLEGARVRVHRRHRRGDRATSKASRTSPRPCTA